MSVIASDDFNRANGALGSNWTAINNAIAIVSNEAKADLDPEISYWNAVAAPDDCESGVVLGSIVVSVAENGGGCMIRQDEGANTSYFSLGNGETVELWIVEAGSYTQLDTAANPCATGDTIATRGVGTTITSRKNGSTVNSVTDATLTSGRAGLWMADQGTEEPTVTSWYLDDLAVAGGDAFVLKREYLSMKPLTGIY